MTDTTPHDAMIEKIAEALRATLLRQSGEKLQPFDELSPAIRQVYRTGARMIFPVVSVFVEQWLCERDGTLADEWIVDMSLRAVAEDDVLADCTLANIGRHDELRMATCCRDRQTKQYAWVTDEVIAEHPGRWFGAASAERIAIYVTLKRSGDEQRREAQ